MDIEKFLKIEEARASLFNLFSALFCQPEDDILRNKELFHTLKQAFETLHIKKQKDIDNLEDSLQKYSETELLIEYARLFVGPFKTLAPPYSSVYLGEPTVMSEETIWVVNQYRSMGLDFNMEIRDLPDHIAVETEYLYYLIFEEIKSLQEKKFAEAKKHYDAQAIFLNDHFNKWVAKFCNHGMKETNNEYYNSLFKCLDIFVRSATLANFPEN